MHKSNSVVPVIWKFGFRIEDGIQTIIKPKGETILPGDLITLDFISELPHGLIVHRVGLHVVCSLDRNYDPIISGGSVSQNDYKPESRTFTFIDHPLWVFVKNAEDAFSDSIRLDEYDPIMSLALSADLAAMDQSGVFSSFPINQNQAYLSTKAFNGKNKLVSTKFTFDKTSEKIIHRAKRKGCSVEVALCFIGEAWGRNL